MSEAVQAVGTVEAGGGATSHVLRDDNGQELYALRSERVDLGDYEGERVTVTGSLDPEHGPAAGKEGLAVLIVTDIERGSAERRSL
ncbi:MAG: DUF5818 domain-containing protein [Actinomycetota bacterium]